MTSRTIPPLLEPYLAIEPPQSQILLTGLLGANTNWLLLRYLYTLLKSKSQQQQQAQPTRPQQHQPQGQRRVGLRIPVAAEPGLEPPAPAQNGGGANDEEGESVRVLLVSFLRDFAFWKESAGRLGLDLEGLGRRGKLGFVDGLCVGVRSGSGYDGESGGAGGGGVSGAVGGGLPVRSRPPVPVAAGGVPGRGPPQAAPTSPVTRESMSQGQGQGHGPAAGEKWKRSLPSLAVADVSKTLHAALDELCQKNKKVVLVIDQLDFLLAATSDGNGLVSSALKDLLLDLREVSHPTSTRADRCMHTEDEETDD